MGLGYRSKSVVIDNIRSNPKNLPFGVPQGSDLGPIEFIIYSSPIAKIVRQYGLNVHLYADDTQIYISFNLQNPNEAETTMAQVEACIAQVRSWMISNKLMINNDRTVHHH